MADQETRDRSEEYFRRALKSLKTEEIEQMIANVLGEAANRDYEVKIKRIDFEPVEHASNNDVTEQYLRQIAKTGKNKVLVKSQSIDFIRL